MKKENETTTTILLDCDGVIFAFLPAFDTAVQDYCVQAGVKVPRKAHTHLSQSGHEVYDLTKRFVGINTQEKAKKILQFMTENKYYENMQLLPGAAEALENIMSYDIKIKFVTAIPDNTAEERLRNINNVTGLNFEREDVVGVGLGLSKQAAIEKIANEKNNKIIAFVEDRGENLDSVSQRLVSHKALIHDNEAQHNNFYSANSVAPSLFLWTTFVLPLVYKSFSNNQQMSLPLVNYEEGEVSVGGILDKKHLERTINYIVKNSDKMPIALENLVKNADYAQKCLRVHGVHIDIHETIENALVECGLKRVTENKINEPTKKPKMRIA